LLRQLEYQTVNLCTKVVLYLPVFQRHLLVNNIVFTLMDNIRTLRDVLCLHLNHIYLNVMIHNNIIRCIQRPFRTTCILHHACCIPQVQKQFWLIGEEEMSNHNHLHNQVDNMI
jgi:hypothetical protein